VRLPIAPSVLLAFVPRGFILWLGGRGVAIALVALAEQDLRAVMRAVVESPASLAPAAIIAATLLAAVELSVRREGVLLANLGLPAVVAVAVVSAVAALAECLCWAAATL
jgi:hypothetical protein